MTRECSMEGEINTFTETGVCHVCCNTRRTLQVQASSVPITIERSQVSYEFVIKEPPPKDEFGLLHLIVKYRNRGDSRYDTDKGAILIVENKDGKPWLHYKENAKLWHPTPDKLTQFNPSGYYSVDTPHGKFTCDPADDRSKFRYVDPQTLLEFVAGNKDIGDLVIVSTKLGAQEDEQWELKKELEFHEESHRLCEEELSNLRVKYHKALKENTALKEKFEAAHVDGSIVSFLDEQLYNLQSMMFGFRAFSGNNRFSMLKYIDLMIAFLNKSELGAKDDLQTLIRELRKMLVWQSQIIESFPENGKKTIRHEMEAIITEISRYRIAKDLENVI
jgi:hypothetical protein